MRKVFGVGRWGALAVALLAAGCVREQTVTITRQGPPMVTGKAKVVEVNARLGVATVDMRGKRFNIYWKPEIVVAHSGTVVPPQSMLDPPVGAYEAPTVVPTAFPAKPGDVIEFLGMRSGDDILLSRVAVIPQ
ncbi:MAG TPA: hypothetical protein VHQ47_00900 [Phycisphaerae bacterium]|jgi:hypothetical protein|nr:hypothetical protein [Phycisphaerae bacterium]